MVVQDGEDARLDAFVAARVETLSRSAVQRLIDEGQVTVDGLARLASYKVRPGEVVEVTIPEARPAEVKPEALEIGILYQDSDLVVINKPKGMATHPSPGTPAGTLVNALLSCIDDLSGIGGVERPGIVHRLDKDTSGVLVVAKNDRAHLALSEQIAARTAVRKYLALVWGDPQFEVAEVDTPLGRHPKDRMRMAVVRDVQRYHARHAVTDLTVLERFTGFALLEAGLRTGRTHQIRVHCSFIGHPVVGDPVYGGTKRALPQSLGRAEREQLAALISGLKGQALHAFELSFDHPTSGERMTFSAPLPADTLSLVNWLREHSEARG
jgi:23S rRNA pseudouridine1911/1915/1917 synthase